MYRKGRQAIMGPFSTSFSRALNFCHAAPGWYVFPLRSFVYLLIFALLLKVEAFVRISTVNVGDIDTVKQEFDCEFYLSVRWAEPRLKYDSLTGTVIENEPRWEPSIFFANLLQHDLYEMNQVVKFPELVRIKTMYITSYYCSTVGICVYITRGGGGT